MPYAFETNKTPLPEGTDKRVKLTPQQRDEIRANVGNLSQRALAAEYNVSRRLVQFIQDPSKHAENLARRQERGGSAQYYDKDKHRDSMREYRKSKQERLK